MADGSSDSGWDWRNGVAHLIFFLIVGAGMVLAFGLTLVAGSWLVEKIVG